MLLLLRPLDSAWRLVSGSGAPALETGRGALDWPGPPRAVGGQGRGGPPALRFAPPQQREHRASDSEDCALPYRVRETAGERRRLGGDHPVGLSALVAHGAGLRLAPGLPGWVARLLYR